MAFKFAVSKEAIAGQDVVPAGIYDVKLIGFKPQLSKKGDSLNYNPMMEIVNHPDFAGRKLFDSLNTGAGWLFEPFVQCFGLALETEDGENFNLPGKWDGDPQTYKEDDPTTYKYVGPLLGRTGKVEVSIDSYNNKDKNVIAKYGYLKNVSLG